MNKLLIAILALVSCSDDTTPPRPTAAPESPGSAAIASAPERPARPAVDVIKFEAPKDWVKEEPSSNMRKAQYKVPDKDKKGADAQMALFYFGNRNDMLDDNLKRWAQQMGAADPKTEVLQGKCKIHLVDLKGTYTGDQQQGAQENQRLLAAVVENADGPWYFKLVGPAETVGPRRDDFIKMLNAAGEKKE